MEYYKIGGAEGHTCVYDEAETIEEAQANSDMLDYMHEPIGSEEWYRMNPVTKSIMMAMDQFMSRGSEPEFGLFPVASLRIWLEALANQRDIARHENGGALAANIKAGEYVPS